jgi:hypothetical protein
MVSWCRILTESDFLMPLNLKEMRRDLARSFCLFAVFKGCFQNYQPIWIVGRNIESIQYISTNTVKAPTLLFRLCKQNLWILDFTHAIDLSWHVEIYIQYMYIHF